MNPTRPAAATQPTCSYRDGVDQAADRFDPGDDGRQGDHRDHEQSREVFGTTESVGVAPGGGLGAERERDPQRNRGQRVGEVVDGVGQQRDRPRDQHDHQLGNRGGTECEQTDLHRPDTGGTGFQGTVDAVGGVMAMRGEHFPQRGTDLAAAPAVAVSVTMSRGLRRGRVRGRRCPGRASWVTLGVPSVGPGSTRR